jgi:hypothetical protein
VQKSTASLCCTAFSIGFQLFGDSEGRVRVYEKNVLQSTLSVLSPPTGSDLLDGEPGALERFLVDCGSKELVSIVPFARGFAAVTRGGFLAICGVMRQKCAPSFDIPATASAICDLSFTLWY